MDFATKVHEAAYGTVKEWMADLFAEQALVDEEVPLFNVSIGKMPVTVMVEPMGEDQACLDIFSLPVGEREIADSSLRRLLELNAQYRFGHACLQPNGNLVCELTVSMDGLTKDALERFVAYVSLTASHFAEALEPQR